MSYGIADGLEEEECEKAADACLPLRLGHPQTEPRAHGGVDCEHERRVDPVQYDHAHEAAVSQLRQPCAEILEQRDNDEPANGEGDLAEREQLAGF